MYSSFYLVCTEPTYSGVVCSNYYEKHLRIAHTGRACVQRTPRPPRLYLPRQREQEPDNCYVPAGWFLFGGRPRVLRHCAQQMNGGGQLERNLGRCADRLPLWRRAWQWRFGPRWSGSPLCSRGLAGLALDVSRLLNW
jgi:hypothetical protein